MCCMPGYHLRVLLAVLSRFATPRIAGRIRRSFEKVATEVNALSRPARNLRLCFGTKRKARLALARHVTPVEFRNPWP